MTKKIAQKELREKLPIFADKIEVIENDGAVTMLVPVSYVGKLTTESTVSLKKLQTIATSIEVATGVLPDISVFEDRAAQELSAVFERLLRTKFKDVIECAVSWQDAKSLRVTVRVESVGLESHGEISEFVQDFARDADLEIADFQWAVEKKGAPPRALILRLVKTLQPISLADLNLAIRNQDYEIGVGKLSAVLDRLRKNGLIVWRAPDIYTLTYKGLQTVPTSKSAASSDVARALALSKRKW